jgi:hypothetical protein
MSRIGLPAFAWIGLLYFQEGMDIFLRDELLDGEIWTFVTMEEER